MNAVINAPLSLKLPNNGQGPVKVQSVGKMNNRTSVITDLKNVKSHRRAHAYCATGKIPSCLNNAQSNVSDDDRSHAHTQAKLFG